MYFRLDKKMYYTDKHWRNLKIIVYYLSEDNVTYELCLMYIYRYVI